MPKNDLIISGEDFISLLLQNERIDHRQPKIDTTSRSSSDNYESTIFTKTETQTQSYEINNNRNAENYKNESTLNDTNDNINSSDYYSNYERTENPEFLTTTDVSTELNGTDQTLTDSNTESANTTVESVTKVMKVMNVEVLTSTQEVTVMTRRTKTKHEFKNGSKSSSIDAIDSNSNKFHAFVPPPDIINDESQILYSSVPKSRMQRKQDNDSPYQTIIHHDNQGTISFSSLSLPKNPKSHRGSSWWWYGYNYTQGITNKNLYATTTTTTTERPILHNLNKIPYDELNAPVDDSQNYVHNLLGRFIPSCKQPVHDIKKDETEHTDTDTSKSIDNKNHETNIRSESEDAKAGYVVEGRNYRKYRVEEKTDDGFIVGEYGVLSHNDGSLRGVRYTADSNINPRLIQDALLKFLSL